jgi:hypothetical protein
VLLQRTAAFAAAPSTPVFKAGSCITAYTRSTHAAYTQHSNVFAFIPSLDTVVLMVSKHHDASGIQAARRVRPDSPQLRNARSRPATASAVPRPTNSSSLVHSSSYESVYYVDRSFYVACVCPEPVLANHRFVIRTSGIRDRAEYRTVPCSLSSTISM